MSVTFEPANQVYYSLYNDHFDKTKQEDPIMNPRYMQEPLYPSLNISNINFITFANYLKFREISESVKSYSGILPLKKIPELISHLKREIEFTELYKRYCIVLMAVCEVCLILQCDLTWA